jgi:hypothetical protein
LSGPVVVVDHRVERKGFEVLPTVAFDRRCDVLEQIGQTALVVGVDPIPRGSTLSVHAHAA